MIDDRRFAEDAVQRTDVSASPHVSVVIPARNAAKTIGQQLEALALQGYQGQWEVIVADNASTDATQQVVESLTSRFQNLRIVQAGSPPSPNRARSAGARAAAGDHLLFCDADDVVAPGWMAALVRGLGEFDAVGGALDVESLNKAAPKGLRGPPPRDRLPTHAGFLPQPQAANVGVRRHVLEALGGFDERYDLGGDDTEFFWRLQLEGYTLGFVPDAVVSYRYHSSIRAGLQQVYRYGRGHPRLYRAFRDRGMPRNGTRQVVRNWSWLVRHLPDLVRTRHRRLRWIGRAALCFGRVVGSVRHRVVYL